MEQKKYSDKPHSLSIENRAKGTVTGVLQVVSSSDTALTLETSAGGLVIAGTELKIIKFDVDSGALSFEGAANAVKYSGAKQSIWKRMFS